MKLIFKFSIILFIALLACKRDKVDVLGPSYISAPKGFSVSSFTYATNTMPSVDFATDKVLFDATFSDNVSWIITITGKKSKAVHKITGTSKGFTGQQWTGKHDEVIFFRKGETATATLSFYGTSISSSMDILVTDVPDYTTCGIFAQFGHFEDTSAVLPYYVNPSSNNHYSLYYASFNFPDSIANESQGIDSVAVDYNGNLVPAAQGEKYYYIKGLGAQNVFVSGLQYKGAIFPIPDANPYNVWVNLLVYGTGDANASIDLEYQEADDGGINYIASIHDAWVAHITLDHVGWKLFSYRYSDLVRSSNKLFGGSGNGIQQPQNLRNFDVVLLKKSNPNSPVEVYFDYPIITMGGPFKPCK